MLKYKYMIAILCIIFGFVAQSQMPIVPENQDFSGSQNEKWYEVQNSLAKIKTKLDSQKIVVEGLLYEKRQNEGKISKEQIDNLRKQHERLNKLSEQYNTLLADFEYKYPEKGLSSGRKYIRIESQSLESMEQNLSFEGRLNKLNKKIKKQYQVKEENPFKRKNPKSDKIEEAIKSSQDKKKDETDITEKIILVK